jgi:hypothetical protein
MRSEKPSLPLREPLVRFAACDLVNAVGQQALEARLQPSWVAGRRE